MKRIVMLILIVWAVAATGIAQIKRDSSASPGVQDNNILNNNQPAPDLNKPVITNPVNTSPSIITNPYNPSSIPDYSTPSSNPLGTPVITNPLNTPSGTEQLNNSVNDQGQPVMPANPGISNPSGTPGISNPANSSIMPDTSKTPAMDMNKKIPGLETPDKSVTPLPE
jgi:hypothetical protein